MAAAPWIVSDELWELVDGVRAVRGAIGRLRRRPDSLIADRGYTTSTGGCSGSAASSR